MGGRVRRDQVELNLKLERAEYGDVIHSLILIFRNYSEACTVIDTKSKFEIHYYVKCVLRKLFWYIVQKMTGNVLFRFNNAGSW